MLKILTTSLIVLVLHLPLSVAAENPDDSWSNVFKFQSKMAQLGNVRAQYILAEMYEEGRGVKQSNEKAIEWYEKAQRNGHEDAAVRITQIKLKIANKKLAKQKAIQKAKLKKKAILKAKSAKKSLSKKKVKQNKKAVQTKKKTVATKEPVKPLPVAKPKRANASPDDLSRGAGTHMDTNDDEDPFE